MVLELGSNYSLSRESTDGAISILRPSIKLRYPGYRKVR